MSRPLLARRGAGYRRRPLAGEVEVKNAPIAETGSGEPVRIVRRRGGLAEAVTTPLWVDEPGQGTARTCRWRWR